MGSVTANWSGFPQDGIDYATHTDREVQKIDRKGEHLAEKPEGRQEIPPLRERRFV
jgi:hypothetical protein